MCAAFPDITVLVVSLREAGAASLSAERSQLEERLTHQNTECLT